MLFSGVVESHYSCYLLFQIVGAFWYLFAVERTDACWQNVCINSGKCSIKFLYCQIDDAGDSKDWKRISQNALDSQCAVVDDNPPFNYGIYAQALSSGIVASQEVFSKYCYCLWWGLQNLRQATFAYLSIC